MWDVCLCLECGGVVGVEHGSGRVKWCYVGVSSESGIFV